MKVFESGDFPQLDPDDIPGKSKPEPDVVLLVHGTFAYRDSDTETDPARPPAWWQEGSEFVRVTDGLLGSLAACWAGSQGPGCPFPWSVRRWRHRLQGWIPLRRRQAGA